MSESFEFKIATSSGVYPVRIASGSTSTEQQRDAIWLLDRKVSKLYAEAFNFTHISISAIESKKTLGTVAKIIESIREQGGTKNSTLVACGGGIIQDIATFAASCYMRGVSWVYAPTTLLSMVDSCIGGKSSINVGKYKNIAGNFYPPEEVVIDTDFCKTLSTVQLVEGLCEAAKICYAASDDCFSKYLDEYSLDQWPPSSNQLARLIHRSLMAKKKFIEEDEFDQNIRLLLNFGHTFGHAIEGATSYRISHGVAVGLGMLAARHHSAKLAFYKKEPKNVAALTQHIQALLRLAPEVSSTLKQMEPSAALECFRSDKKHSKESFTLILFKGDGRLQRVKIPRSPENEFKILETFQHLVSAANEIQ